MLPFRSFLNLILLTLLSFCLPLPCIFRACCIILLLLIPFTASDALCCWLCCLFADSAASYKRLCCLSLLLPPHVADSVTLLLFIFFIFLAFSSALLLLMHFAAYIKQTLLLISKTGAGRVPLCGLNKNNCDTLSFIFIDRNLNLDDYTLARRKVHSARCSAAGIRSCTTRCERGQSSGVLRTYGG